MSTSCSSMRLKSPAFGSKARTLQMKKINFVGNPPSAIEFQVGFVKTHTHT